MATMINCPVVHEFSTDEDTTSVTSWWKRWIDTFEDYLTAMSIDVPGWEVLLLHLAGVHVYNIYSGLPETRAPGESLPVLNAYAKAKTQLNGYFSPKTPPDTRGMFFPRQNRKPMRVTTNSIIVCIGSRSTVTSLTRTKRSRARLSYRIPVQASDFAYSVILPFISRHCWP